MFRSVFLAPCRSRALWLAPFAPAALVPADGSASAGEAEER